mmetsp:Transcript_6535/g.8300  ORF Transcript_6535/g.8300 Transcript_6535/m.8300 type:complete len:392 (+) Transcript_6535:94-1269(+)
MSSTVTINTSCSAEKDAMSTSFCTDDKSKVIELNPTKPKTVQSVINQSCCGSSKFVQAENKMVNNLPVNNQTSLNVASTKSAAPPAVTKCCKPKVPKTIPSHGDKKLKRACEECTRSKIRCNGQERCQLCTRRGVECVYKPKRRRGPRKKKLIGETAKNKCTKQSRKRKLQSKKSSAKFSTPLKKKKVMLNAAGSTVRKLKMEGANQSPSTKTKRKRIKACTLMTMAKQKLAAQQEQLKFQSTMWTTSTQPFTHKPEAHKFDPDMFDDDDVRFVADVFDSLYENDFSDTDIDIMDDDADSSKVIPFGTLNLGHGASLPLDYEHEPDQFKFDNTDKADNNCNLTIPDVDLVHPMTSVQNTNSFLAHIYPEKRSPRFNGDRDIFNFLSPIELI